jgi:hypothetical protein
VINGAFKRSTSKATALAMPWHGHALAGDSKPPPVLLAQVHAQRIQHLCNTADKACHFLIKRPILLHYKRHPNKIRKTEATLSPTHLETKQQVVAESLLIIFGSLAAY